MNIQNRWFRYNIFGKADYNNNLNVKTQLYKCTTRSHRGFVIMFATVGYCGSLNKER